MNKVERLVSQLCPDGVPMFKLGELEDNKVLKLGRGDVISKNDLNDSPGIFPVYSSSATSNGTFGRYGKYMFDDERITWSIDGGGKFFHRPIHKYSVTNVCGWLKVVQSEKLITKYVYYVLISAWGGRTYNYTVKAHPSVIREDYLIPLPPIEVQREIVRILDTFTELEAELEADLKVRKTQHSHYRDKIFSSSSNFELKAVRELCTIKTGKKDVNQGNPHGQYPFYTCSRTHTYSDSYSFDTEALLIAGNGEVGLVQYFDGKFEAYQRTYVLSDFTNVQCQYLFQFLKAYLVEHLSTLKQDGTISYIKLGMLADFMVPVPPFELQKEFISVFEKFESLELELEGEIAARRQQYEYYRNKLLTFKELEV